MTFEAHFLHQLVCHLLSGLFDVNASRTKAALPLSQVATRYYTSGEVLVLE